MSDLEFAHAVLVLEADPIEDAPILDLRLRKGIRRHGMRLVQASAADLLADRGSHRAPIGAERVSELTGQLRAAGDEIVILWHERLTAGPDGDAGRQGAARAGGRTVAGRHRWRGPAGNPCGRERSRSARGGRAAERRSRAVRARRSGRWRGGRPRRARHRRWPGRGRAGGGAAVAVRPDESRAAERRR